MRIDKALPPEKYAKALVHSETDNFKNLKQKTIKRVQDFYKDPRVNQNIIPALWFGFGKDSMALAIILRLAELDYVRLTIDNGYDLPIHWSVIPEWDKYITDNFKWNEPDIYQLYTTDRPHPQIVRAYLDWGNSYGIRTKEGKPLSFWDWGEMRDSINHEAVFQFHFLYEEEEKNVLWLWANRQGEGQERAFEIAKKGLLQHCDNNDENLLPFFRSLPIGDWKDIDVWALLISEYSPISPIYSFHQIPQKAHNKAFPRTIGYCFPELLCSTFYKWLAKYAPVQLKELNKLFPEIPAKFKGIL
jgi:3'-phosphoadenosine 5'-phosphosulfate sulfotransferase (PAPS reductase)/FAD synthetase